MTTHGTATMTRRDPDGHPSDAAPPAQPRRPPGLDEVTREGLYGYFRYAWRLYEWLFSGIEPSDHAFHRRPNPFRNSIGFYYGHTAAFYVQKLRMAGALEGPVDEELDAGLDRGVSPRTPAELVAGGPRLDYQRLRRYRRAVHDRIEAAIEAMEPEPDAGPGSPAWALLMGVEHDLIHFQTSIPLIRQLALDRVQPPDGWRCAPTRGEGELSTEWVSLPGGEVTLGRDPARARSFGWDNEFGVVTREVEGFQVARLPVTNRQYLEFVRDGGYERPELWTSAEAEIWQQALRPSAPAAWVDAGGGEYRYRSVFQERDMPWDWPVELNRHEAVAFANWAGHALISEAQFQHVLDRCFDGAAAVRGNLDAYNCEARLGSPTPAGQPAGALGAGGVDLVGSVARWARDDFQPLDEDGFREDPLYDDFSRPWFGADHGLLLGAGFTACGHLAQVGLMRDFMQNHMDQVAGASLVR